MIQVVVCHVYVAAAQVPIFCQTHRDFPLSLYNNRPEVLQTELMKQGFFLHTPARLGVCTEF